MPRAMTPSAISGSNIRGKIVTKSIRIIESLGQIDRHRLRFEINLRADLARERDIELSIAALDLQQDAAAAFVKIDDFALLFSVGVDERQADQIVQEVLVLFELARFALGNLDHPVAERIDILGR